MNWDPNVGNICNSCNNCIVSCRVGWASNWYFHAEWYSLTSLLVTYLLHSDRRHAFNLQVNGDFQQADELSLHINSSDEFSGTEKNFPCKYSITLTNKSVFFSQESIKILWVSWLAPCCENWARCCSTDYGQLSSFAYHPHFIISQPLTNIFIKEKYTGSPWISLKTDVRFLWSVAHMGSHGHLKCATFKFLSVVLPFNKCSLFGYSAEMTHAERDLSLRDLQPWLGCLAQDYGDHAPFCKVFIG